VLIVLGTHFVLGYEECWHSGLYGVADIHCKEAHVTIQ
jgi:hypothetical protein